MNESRGRSSNPIKALRSRSRSRSRPRSRKSWFGRKKKDASSTSGSAVVSEASLPPEAEEENPVLITEPVEEPEVITPPSEPVEEKEPGPSIQLVLLLMDPVTRRFELLQLEFDSEKARVSDILAQIPISVTEAALKEQKYEGVIDETVTKKTEAVRLVDFVTEKKVLVAIPNDVPIKECVRLARPILADTQVVKMLEGNGFSLNGWEKKDLKTPAPSPARPESARPSPARPRSRPQETPASPETPVAEPETKVEERETPPTKQGNGNIYKIIVIVALIAIALQITHTFLSSPIEFDVVFPPGTSRSKCGLIGFIPKEILKNEIIPKEILPECTNSYLKVGNDGTVTNYNENDELDWIMTGDVCSKKNCVDGLVVEKDGSVFIGGKRVKSVTVYRDNVSLSPWPFKEKPNVKIVRSKK